MTSWTSLTLLFLLVSTLDLSEAGCLDYFDVQKWALNLTETFSLVDTKDPQDMMECSVEREFLTREREALYFILQHCFKRDEKEPNKTSEKCVGGTSQTVAYYHFMCLTANAINYTPKGCEYDIVCKLFREKPELDQITKFSIFPTTSTATILSSSTPAERTSKTTTTTATQNEVSSSHGQTLYWKDNSFFALKIVLLVSVILNLLEPLAVYLYMRRHRRNDFGQAPPE